MVSQQPTDKEEEVRIAISLLEPVRCKNLFQGRKTLVNANSSIRLKVVVQLAVDTLIQLFLVFLIVNFSIPQKAVDEVYRVVSYIAQKLNQEAYQKLSQ